MGEEPTSILGEDPTSFVIRRELHPLVPQDPQTVESHRLTHRLPGSGHDSVVYLAEPIDAGAGTDPVVVKVLKAGASETARQRFEREINNARRVRSPRVARVLGAGQDGDMAYMIQEYAHGEPLSELLRHVPGNHLDVDNAHRLAIGLLEALSDIHSAGIIHRDVKPGNIIVGPRRAVLVDFGVSRAVGDAGLTEYGTAVGTRRFMSPEQLDGKDVDERSDAFAWGITVAFAASGKHPFDPDSELSDMQLLRAYRAGKPRLDGVPDRLQPALVEALRGRGSTRATVGELLRKLEADAPVTRTTHAVVPLPALSMTDTLSAAGLRNRLQPQYERVRMAVADTAVGYAVACLLAVLLAFPSATVLAVIVRMF